MDVPTRQAVFGQTCGGVAITGYRGYSGVITGYFIFKRWLSLVILCSASGYHNQ